MFKTCWSQSWTCKMIKRMLTRWPDVYSANRNIWHPFRKDCTSVNGFMGWTWVDRRIIITVCMEMQVRSSVKHLRWDFRIPSSGHFSSTLAEWHRLVSVHLDSNTTLVLEFCFTLILELKEDDRMTFDLWPLDPIPCPGRVPKSQHVLPRFVRTVLGCPGPNGG